MIRGVAGVLGATISEWLVLEAERLPLLLQAASRKGGRA